MLVDIISITQVLKSTLDQRLVGLVATTIAPDAAVVLKDRDYKKNYV